MARLSASGAPLTLTKKSAAATVVVVGGTVVVVVGGSVVVVVVGGSVVVGAVVAGAAVVAAPAPLQETASAAIMKRAEARKGRGERLLSRGIDGHRKPLSEERSSSAPPPDRHSVEAAPYTRSATNPPEFFVR